MVRRSLLMFFLATCPLTARGQQFSTVPLETRQSLIAVHAADTPVSVRITPSRAGTERAESRAPNAWKIEGYELRTLIANVYGFDAARINFADPRMAAKHFDVSVSVPHCEPDDVMRERVRAAMSQQLRIDISGASAERDVYVVTAPSGARLRNASGTTTIFTTSSVEVEGEDDREPSRERMNDLLYRKAEKGISLESISMASGTVDDLCTLLEEGLDRPVVNETHLAGKYDVELAGGKLSREEFFSTVWNRLGLRIVRERRNVAMLNVRPE